MNGSFGSDDSELIVFEANATLYVPRPPVNDWSVERERLKDVLAQFGPLPLPVNYVFSDDSDDPLAGAVASV